MTTRADRDLRPGRPADFTSTLESALRAREIDLAVHSAKDLLAEDSAGLAVAAYPRRADPRDCLVLQRADLRAGARIGSSSLRRHAQLLRWNPSLRVEEVRGNVDTRIRLVRDRQLDGVILAKAGIDRLRRSADISVVLPLQRFLPAPGQGALAVQVRARDRGMRTVVATIDHRPTRAAVEAERAVAAALGASCDIPLGALALSRGGRLHLRAEVLSPDGARSIAVTAVGAPGQATAIARRAARRLRTAGVRDLLERA